MANLSPPKNTIPTLDLGRLVGIAEAAKFLDVRESWLYARTRRNSIPFLRLGKYVKFNLAELLTWARTTSVGEEE